MSDPAVSGCFARTCVDTLHQLTLSVFMEKAPQPAEPCGPPHRDGNR